MGFFNVFKTMGSSIGAAISHPVEAISHGVINLEQSAGKEFNALTSLNPGQLLTEAKSTIDQDISKIKEEGEKVGKFIVNHPIQSAVIGISVVAGIGLTVATGGIAGPEVAEGIALEVGAAGAAGGAEVALGAGAEAAGSGLADIVLSPFEELLAGPAESAAEDLGIDTSENFFSTFAEDAGDEKASEIIPTGGSPLSIDTSLSSDSTQFFTPSSSSSVDSFFGSSTSSSASSGLSSFNFANLTPIADSGVGLVADQSIFDFLGVGNASEMAEALGDNPSLLARGIARFGGPALAGTLGRVASIVGTGFGIAGGIASIMESVNQAKDAKSEEERLKHIKDMIDKANKIAREHFKKEQGTLQTIKEDEDDIKVSMKSIKATEKQNADVTQQLLKSSKQMNKLEHTTNDRLKQIIRDNRGNQEAQQHAAIKLDSELQALKSEEVKEVGELARISTILDRPQTVYDFRKDLKDFETAVAKADYIAENYATLINLNSNDIDSILDLLIDGGVLTLVN